MRVIQLSPPEFEPVSLDDAKAYCRVRHTLENSLITGMISSARQMCENYSRVPFCQQGYRAEFRWPRIHSLYGLRHRTEDPDLIARGVPLPRFPVREVSEVKLLNTGDAETWILGAADYTRFNDRVVITRDVNREGEYTDLWVTFEAGWPAGDGEEAVATCPAIMKQCVLEQVAFMLQNRGDVASKLSPKVRAKLAMVASAAIGE